MDSLQEYKMKIFSSTKQSKNKKRIFGFDIETYSKKNKFLCASVWCDNRKFRQFFTDKQKLINFFKQNIFRNSLVAATNLSFDFFGVFVDSEEVRSFNTLFRNANLLYAKTYLVNGTFNRKAVRKVPDSLTFIDTLNYAFLSVEEMGKLIKAKKLQKPSFLGRKPKNKEEWEQLKEYNMRDAEVSVKGLMFLYDSFEKLGATPKLTIASTAMSLFKNKYLKDKYFVHDEKTLMKLFNAYYGGRCEAFGRGKFLHCNLYDYNSLYPDVMRNDFPNPNTIRHNTKNSKAYIESFDGVAHVRVFCPEMRYPLLPLKQDGKLLFPTGIFEGWYSNVELRKAIRLGYTLLDVYENIYYKENCQPFHKYVTDLYEKRQKSKGTPMDFVVKLLMNSLYGKFGQKFGLRDNWIPMPETVEEIHKYPFFERFGNFARIKKSCDPSSFCFPIWALYVSAYGRIKLYDLIVESKAIYCDTDSVITEKEYIPKEGLGELKLEMPIKVGVIVKPKFYAVTNYGNRSRVKAKGLGFKLCMKDFYRILTCRKAEYRKFVKFKESMRRGLVVNEIVDVVKELKLEDDKRNWGGRTFNHQYLQLSTPRNVTVNTRDEIRERYRNSKKAIPDFPKKSEIFQKNI